jgi:hypothetical protein
VNFTLPVDVFQRATDSGDANGANNTASVVSRVKQLQQALNPLILIDDRIN